MFRNVYSNGSFDSYMSRISFGETACSLHAGNHPSYEDDNLITIPEPLLPPRKK